MGVENRLTVLVVCFSWSRRETYGGSENACQRHRNRRKVAELYFLCGTIRNRNLFNGQCLHPT